MVVLENVCSFPIIASPAQGGGALKVGPTWPADCITRPRRVPPGTGAARSQQDPHGSAQERRGAAHEGTTAISDPVYEVKVLLRRVEGMQQQLSAPPGIGGGLRGGGDMRAHVGALQMRVSDLMLQAERHASATSSVPGRQLSAVPAHIVATLKLLQREHQSLCNILHLAHKDLIAIGLPNLMCPYLPPPVGLFFAPPGRQALLDKMLAANGLTAGPVSCHVVPGGAETCGQLSTSRSLVVRGAWGASLGATPPPEEPQAYKVTAPSAYKDSRLAKFREEIERRVNAQIESRTDGDGAAASGAATGPPGGGPGSTARPPLLLGPPVPEDAKEDDTASPAGELLPVLPVQTGGGKAGVAGVETGPSLHLDVVLQLSQKLTEERETVMGLCARVAQLADKLRRRDAELAAALEKSERERNNPKVEEEEEDEKEDKVEEEEDNEEEEYRLPASAGWSRRWMSSVGSSWWRRPPPGDEEGPKGEEGEWVLYRDGEEVKLHEGREIDSAAAPPRPGHSPPSIRLPFAPRRRGEGRRAPPPLPPPREPTTMPPDGDEAGVGADVPEEGASVPGLAAAAEHAGESAALEKVAAGGGPGVHGQMANGDEGAPAVVPRITLFYETGWTTAYLHYTAGSGGWTDVPGVPMKALEGSPDVKAISVETEGMEFVVNNGAGDWDRAPDGGNYKIRSPGTYRLSFGNIVPLDKEP